MRHARLEKSDRLQRVLRVLLERRAGKGWITTRQIARKAHVCAVNSCIAELRENGCSIDCEQRRERGAKRFYYRLVTAPEGWDG